MAEPKVAPKTPPEPKPEPKAEPPSPEAVALAESIDSGIPVDYVEQPGGAVTPASPPATSKETEPKPAGDQPKAKTPASEEEPAGGTPDGDGEPGEGDEDPFEGLADLKPDEVLAKLLEHPAVGPVLQRWSDLAGDAQSASAIEQERGTIANEARTQAEDAHWDEHFKGMSEDEVAEEIAKDSKAAVAYARYQQRQQAEPELDPDRVTRASQVYGYAIQVATYDLMVKDSKLPDEKKAELKGENFKDQGPDGIIAWGNAIYGALIEHEAAIRANELLASRWETFQQERMAETDGDRPPMVRGRKVAGTLPDLIKTDTGALFDHAFSQPKPPDKS